MKVYVLMYHSFDGGCCVFTETVTASLDRKALETYKKVLEENSKVAREHISTLQQQMWADNSDIHAELRKTRRIENPGKYDRLLKQLGDISAKFYSDKQKYLDNLNLEVFLEEEEEMEQLTIDELDLI